MSIPITPAQIIHCLKHDGYTAEQGARYCRAIAWGAHMNGNSVHEAAYSEAAARLESEVIDHANSTETP